MTTQKRILITGAAGHIGHQLGNRLAQDHFVFGTDISKREGLDFPLEVLDVRDNKLVLTLAEYRITHVIHLASVLQASPDRQRDYDIDINGTRNVLEASVAAKVQHLTVITSGAAYGFHADNPPWIDEDTPLQGNPEFACSDHKRKVEELLARYRAEHPQLQQLIFRPGTMVGAETRDPITDLFLAPRLLAIRGSQSPFVFVSDQDLVGALEQGVREDSTGRYNIAGDGALSIREIARKLDKPLLVLPAGVMKAGLQIGKWLGRPVTPQLLDRLRYPPVLSNRRLKEDFGYGLQMTSAQTFDAFLRQARQKGEL
ncbi:MAG: NAD-dependent epimerase/dehydratase family protein [Marinobacter sp.]